MQKLMQWIRENHGVVSIAGGLVVFFSWTATNTLVQRYGSMKQTAESAEATFRLYTTLHSLRDQLNTVTIELIRNRTGPGAVSRRPAEPEMDALRTEFALARLDAQQVTEMGDFAFETMSYSLTLGTPTPASGEVQRLATAIDDVLQRLREMEAAVEACRGGHRDSLRSAVRAYVEYVRNGAVSRVERLYPQIVAASNLRREEGRAELARAKWRSNVVSRMARFLYVIGSFMALTGQYLDKIRSRRKPAAASGAAQP